MEEIEETIRNEEDKGFYNNWVENGKKNKDKYDLLLPMMEHEKNHTNGHMIVQVDMASSLVHILGR